MKVEINQNDMQNPVVVSMDFNEAMILRAIVYEAYDAKDVARAELLNKLFGGLNEVVNDPYFD
jgi:hypothetical protein